jgi:MFS family permease
VARFRTFEALGFREFRLLWLGQLGSAMTLWMDQVTRGWLMYDLTGSALQLGLVTLVQVLPLLLLSPVAGTAADRYGRKTQLVIAQLLNVPPALILGILVISGRVEPWHLYATGLAAAIVQVFQQPARQALIPESVDRARLTNAIGLTSIAFNVSRSVGPAIAGAIIALVGAGGSYLVQALIYGLTTLAALQLRLPNLPSTTPGGNVERPRSFLASTVEGWQYIAAHETIRTAMLVSVMAQFLGMSFTILLPVFARDVLEVGPAGQGFLLTAQGLGALCSAFVVASMRDSAPKGKLVIIGVTLYGLLELGFSASHWFAVSVAFMVLIGVCHVAANALVQTIIQGHAAPALQGRVIAVWQQNQVFNVAGGLLAGAAASQWGAPATVAVMGVTCALGAMTIFVTIPHVRGIR